MGKLKEHLVLVKKLTKKAIEENEAKNMENFFRGKEKEKLIIKLPPSPIYHLMIDKKSKDKQIKTA